MTTAVSLVLGAPLAWDASPDQLPWPATAAGTGDAATGAAAGGRRVALLLAFGRTGFIGRYLDDWFGLTIV